MIVKKQVMIPEDSQENPIISDCRSMLEKGSFEQDENDEFIRKTKNILENYRNHFGAETRIDYIVRRHYGRIELNIFLVGEKYNPLEAEDQENTIKSILHSKTMMTIYGYTSGKNIVTVCSAFIRNREFAIKSPMLWAVVLGIIAGLICRRLPEGAAHFLTEDLASPVFSVIVGIMTGVMGPVVFIMTAYLSC